MAKSYFLIRAVVAPHLRDKFDHWTSSEHLPRALAMLKNKHAEMPARKHDNLPV